MVDCWVHKPAPHEFDQTNYLSIAVIFHSSKLQFDQELKILSSSTSEEQLIELGENALSIFISKQVCMELGGTLFLEHIDGLEYQYIIQVKCTDIVERQ